MSDPNQREPGRFGEDGAAVIQVTPGQIVGAALFLLVAATLIFFAGMFARGLTMSQAEEEPASTEPIAKTMDDGVNLPAPEPKSAEPQPDSTPAPPKQVEAKPPVQPPPKAEPEPQPDPEPEAEMEKKTPAVIEMKPVTAEATPESVPSEPKPEPEPTPAAEEKPAPEPIPPAPEPEPQPLPEIPASTTGPFTVQVMSIGTAKRAQAQAFQRDALENKDVQVMLVDSSDGKWIRAFVGSYANKADAEKARDELARAGFEGCFVKKRDD